MVKTKHVLLNILIVTIGISFATLLFLAQLRSEAVRQANLRQEHRLQTFWELLNVKGTGFTSQAGKMRNGNYLMNNNFELPDKIQKIFGGTATIFMGDVRISTNVLKEDGSRAIGTKLESPAVDAIFKEGRSYRGETSILGVPYFTAYDPIRDPQGKIIGALYVGEKKSEYFATYDSLKRKIITTGLILDIVFSFLAFVIATKRKELIERDHQKMAILNNISDIAWLKDNKSRFIAVNEAFSTACGYSSRDIIGKTDFQVWPAQLAERYQIDDREVMTTGVRKEIEEPMVDKDGIKKWIETIKTPIRDNNNNVIGTTGIARDITERRLNEKALKDSEALLRGIFNNVNEGIIVYDLMGEIIRVNDRALEMYGVEPEEARSMSFLNDSSTMNGEIKHLSLHWKKVLNGENQLFEWIARRNRDGQRFDIEVFLNKIKLTEKYVILAKVTDISERKLNEEKIKESLSLLNATLDSTADGIVVVSNDDKIIRYNQKFIDMTCFASPRRFENDCQEWRSFVMSQLANPDVLSDALSTEKILTDTEHRCTLEFKDGRVIERVSTPQIIDGEITGRVLSYRDITDQRRLEHQLRHSQKMEALGTLTGGIAHDFNNILTAIIGYGTLLQHDCNSGGSSPHFINQILIAAGKASGLTRGLLAYSRKQALEPKPIDLNSVIKGVEKILTRLISEDIELTTNLTEDPLIIFADSGQIEQVLMNLVTNARDAMFGGGRLTIGTSLERIDQGFTDSLGQGNCAVLSVSDTGKGIEETDREKIFEPFFTTKDIGCGTGLGLSIVYGIVKQHQGLVDFRSESGKGTTFNIHLPLTSMAVQEAAVLKPFHIKKGRETILLIEDDDDVRNLFKEILSRKNYKVIEAINGEEGVQKFIDNQTEIQLLLIDVIMPKKNGKETFNEIRGVSPDIKVIFTSGYTDDILSKKGVLDDNLNFISKPLSPTHLLEKVRSVLDCDMQ